jgi:hypothetical protein
LEREALILDQMRPLIEIATAEPSLWRDPFPAPLARALADEVARLARAVRVVLQASATLRASQSHGTGVQRTLAHLAPLVARLARGSRATVLQCAHILDLPHELVAHAATHLATLAAAVISAAHDLDVAYERLAHHRLLPILLSPSYLLDDDSSSSTEDYVAAGRYLVHVDTPALGATALPTSSLDAPRVGRNPLPTHQVLCFNAAMFAMREMALSAASVATYSHRLALHMQAE